VVSLTRLIVALKTQEVPHEVTTISSAFILSRYDFSWESGLRAGSFARALTGSYAHDQSRNRTKSTKFGTSGGSGDGDQLFGRFSTFSGNAPSPCEQCRDYSEQ